MATKYHAVCILALAVSGVVCAQSYPSRPLRIVTSDPGGGNDYAARIIAQGLSASLGQQVIVENRGGSVIIPAEMVAKAPADGYTLLFHGAAVWLTQFMRDQMPFDPLKDFAAVTLTNRQPNILVVHPSLPVHSVPELIAMARKRTGELNYGSHTAGMSTFLSGELFRTMARLNTVRVNYKGAAAAQTALIAGEVQFLFSVPGPAMPHIQSGRLRALAVTTAQPSALAPGLPTLAASGLPGYESVGMVGMFAPAKVAGGIVNRLSQEINRILSAADVKEKFLNAGLEPVGSTPEQFESTVKADMGKMGKLIKDAGIRVD